MKNKTKREVTGGITGLLYNNKIVMLFSIIMAFGIWIWVSIEKSPEIETTVMSVPVQIDLENSVPSQLNLKIFGKSDFSVDVTVKGKKFIVSTLNAEDFVVTAVTNYVDSAGNKSLLVRATTQKSNADFEIVGLSQNYIEVYFDNLKETEFAIESKVASAKPVIDDCILGNIVFSKSTVSVSGPATEINKITGVVAETEIAEPLAATKTITPTITLKGAPIEELSNVKIITGDTPITMTLPVLKKVELPTSVAFKNAPAGFVNNNSFYSVYPSKVQAAVPIEKIDEIKSIVIGTIDFSDVDKGNNTFNMKTSEITDYIILDKTIKTFKVTLNMSGYTSAEYSIPISNIAIIGQNGAYNSTTVLKGPLSVKLIGPQEVIASLKNELIYAEIDLSNYPVTAGVQNVPAHIVVKEQNTCWANGVYNIQISSVAK
ncbi:MAG: hypothetical protein RSB11_00525 [Oscillospiraceae bacterium]